jgi:hypothetical protein
MVETRFCGTGLAAELIDQLERGCVPDFGSRKNRGDGYVATPRRGMGTDAQATILWNPVPPPEIQRTLVGFYITFPLVVSYLEGTPGTRKYEVLPGSTVTGTYLVLPKHCIYLFIDTCNGTKIDFSSFVKARASFTTTSWQELSSSMVQPVDNLQEQATSHDSGARRRRKKRNGTIGAARHAHRG